KLKNKQIKNIQTKTQTKLNEIKKKQHFFKGEFEKKSKFLCMFCGGKNCPKENYLKNPNINAIEGLHSDWINNDILAMQRPSSRIIKDFNLIQQFKNNKIKAVFNLQLPGEHPYCGDNLNINSGFTYSIEEFTDNNIYFFNYGWTDMTVTNPTYMMKIMSSIDFIISQGYKISVHCHAGTGRTGLVIASWLIFNEGMSYEQARNLFKQKRKGGLGKNIQKIFLKEFQECLFKFL
ncbi:protein tyrosine phosphatase domain protein 1 protein, partial [Ichthyophthirius multifiliis]